jgi:hypothetical protein
METRQHFMPSLNHFNSATAVIPAFTESSIVFGERFHPADHESAPTKYTTVVWSVMWDSSACRLTATARDP